MAGLIGLYSGDDLTQSHVAAWGRGPGLHRLHEASAYGTAADIILITQAGVDFRQPRELPDDDENERCNDYRQTPLHRAAQHGNVATAAQLLALAGDNAAQLRMKRTIRKDGTPGITAEELARRLGNPNNILSVVCAGPAPPRAGRRQDRPTGPHRRERDAAKLADAIAVRDIPAVSAILDVDQPPFASIVARRASLASDYRIAGASVGIPPLVRTLLGALHAVTDADAGASMQIAHLLLDHGANPADTCVRACHSADGTALHVAVRMLLAPSTCDQGAVVALMERLLETIAKQKQAGDSDDSDSAPPAPGPGVIDARNASENTALHLACAAAALSRAVDVPGVVKCIKLLLEHGADPKRADYHDDVPLDAVMHSDAAPGGYCREALEVLAEYDCGLGEVLFGIVKGLFRQPASEGVQKVVALLRHGAALSTGDARYLLGALNSFSRGPAKDVWKVLRLLLAYNAWPKDSVFKSDPALLDPSARTNAVWGPGLGCTWSFIADFAHRKSDGYFIRTALPCLEDPPVMHAMRLIGEPLFGQFALTKKDVETMLAHPRIAARTASGPDALAPRLRTQLIDNPMINAKWLRRVLGPWTPETHRLYAPNHRARVLAALGCAHRIRGLEGRTAAGAKHAALPGMPLEIWYEVLKWVTRTP